MHCMSRESFVLQIMLLLECLGVDPQKTRRLLNIHKYPGASVLHLREEIDQSYADAVVNKALDIMEATEEENLRFSAA